MFVAEAMSLQAIHHAGNVSYKLWRTHSMSAGISHAGKRQQGCDAILEAIV
jgi:hypothetical protein